MKTLLYIIFIVLAGTGFSQTEKKVATPEDYREMAEDMCGCVNKYANKISHGMREAIIQAGMNPESMEVIIQEQVMKDPEQGMKDVEAITNLAEGMGKCGKNIDKKYKNLTLDADAAEVQQILLETMKSQKGCEFTYALMVIGQYGKSSEEQYYDEEYYDEEE